MVTMPSTLAFHVEHGAAAVALLDGDGELQHRHAVHVALPDSTPATTLYSSPRGWPRATIGCPPCSFAGSPSGSGFSPLASMRRRARSSLRSEAWIAVTSCLVPSASCTLIGPGLADDVKVGRDQAVGDDEAGAESLLFAVAAGEEDDDDGLLRVLGELLDGLGLALCPEEGRRARAGLQGPGRNSATA